MSSIPTNPLKGATSGPWGLKRIFLLGVLAILVLILLWLAGGFASAFKSTDSGEICVIREGGPLDGRAVAGARKPGEGLSNIGIFNKQECLPATERDSNDIMPEGQTFPTKDSVQVVADGQALFQLTQDQEKIQKFYINYGRRTWGGNALTTDEGWKQFLIQRVQPVLIDTQRQVISEYNCEQMNNLCQYVQNPEAAVAATVAAPKDGSKPATTQNLAAAQNEMSKIFAQKLKEAFKDEYFENVRYQNLRIRFEPEVNAKITQAQTLRTETANAKLEAQRKTEEAIGNAAKKVEEARGARSAAYQQKKAYELNPTQRTIDKLHAFCGDKGCDPKVIGETKGGVILNIPDNARE